MEGESDFSFNSITIIGVGLIGGSLGLALKEKKPDFIITGIDKKEIIEKAIIRGAIDEGTINLEEGIKEADVIILATPVKKILDLLSQINPFLKKGCLVTDTGSTKTQIVMEANKVLSKDINFIGGHPMAGSERGGIEYAHPDLFNRKPYIVIPRTGNSKFAALKMSSFINQIGAIEISMEAAEHDRAVAIISHLPQLISVMMTNMLGSLVEEKDNEQYFRISGNVFNEMTRVANSPFSIWQDIYQTNAEWTIVFIEELENLLEKAKEKITRNPAELEEDFKKARYFKEKILQMIK